MLKRIATASIVLTLVVSGAAFAADAEHGHEGHSPLDEPRQGARDEHGPDALPLHARQQEQEQLHRPCSAYWPPLMTKGKPVAGMGVKQSLLGTAKRGTKLQVTYNGHPLYTFDRRIEGRAGDRRGKRRACFASPLAAR